jgi:hypothetical protein
MRLVHTCKGGGGAVYVCVCVCVCVCRHVAFAFGGGVVEMLWRVV